jgi:outer membrane receptor protein involved in Fe transport
MRGLLSSERSFEMRLRTLLLCVGCALLLALPAFAQGNPTAKLSGRVTNDGQPLPGVQVTASSPNLQGTRTHVTNSNGDYIFPILPPGEYTITFELQGLQTVNRSLRLSAAQEVPLDVEMAVSKVEEEIVVTGSLETISQSTEAATTYTKKLVDQLPVGRGITEIVALAPGVHATGPSKGTDTRISNITISGSPTYENLFLVNGVVVNENIRGQPQILFIEDAIQETTSASAGVSAEFGRFTGGVVNVITKSGGNDFSGSLRVGFTNQKWEGTTPLTVTRTDDIVPLYEATLGGPILRDRLWFFAAGRDFESSSTNNTSTTNIPYTIGRDQKRYEGKLTFSLTQSHTLLGSYIKVKETEIGNSFGVILDLDSVIDRQLPQDLKAVNYNGVLGSNFYLTGQYSKRTFSFVNSGSHFTDLIHGTLIQDRSRNLARFHSPTFCGVCRPEDRDNKNWLAKGSYFLSTGSLGTHEIVAGYDSFDDIRAADNHQSGSDFRVLATGAVIRGSGASTQIFPVFTPVATTIQYNPIALTTQGTSFKTNSLFLNDAWRFSDRLSFNLGLRYDKNDGANAQGKTVAKDDKLSPRLAATFDTEGNGDWLLHASYGVYVAAIANSVADSTSSAGQPATFQWNYNGPAVNANPNGALVDADTALGILFNWFQANGGINMPGAFNVSIPGGNQIIKGGSLASPNVQEYSIGTTKRLGNKGLVRADLVHRDWADFYALHTDTSTGKVTTANGVQDLGFYENDDTHNERTYDGLHTQARYRFSDRFDLGGNYTWSHAKGNFEGENQGSGPLVSQKTNYPEYRAFSQNNPKGDLLIDQRHKLGLYGIFTAFSNEHNSLNVSLLENYFSGHPYSAIGQVRPGAYVTNPGYVGPPVRVDYYFGGRGAFETDDVLRTDIAATYTFKLHGLDFSIRPEVINVFNADNVDTTDVRYLDQTVITADNTSAARICTQAPVNASGFRGCLPFNPFTDTPVEHVNWEKGPNFGKPINPLGYQQPRTYRFSVRLGF